MRIVLFTDSFLPEVNGVARTLGRVVAHAIERGHEVGLVTPRISSQPCGGTAFHHQLAGIPVPVYPELRLARPLDARGRRRLEAFRPDLVHVATESTVGSSGTRWALRTGTPLVTSFHTNIAEYLAGYGLAWMERWVWRHLRQVHGRAEITFCPSRATAEVLRERGFHDRVRIWSRGVDSRHFHPSRRKESVRQRLAPGADRILLYVGRLAPEKRLDVLMAAYREIRDRSSERIALVLVGDGPAASDLRRSAPAGVRFTGYLRGDDLAEAYAAGDIFVFPSDTETFGNVVTEAMASGLPVVAPERGGVTETVRTGRTGILVTPGHVGRMAEAVLCLLNDDALRIRLGAGARAEAEGRSWATILDGLLDGWKEAAFRPRSVDPALRKSLGVPAVGTVLP